MIINHNLQAMNTHRQLGIANSGGAKSMEKLSSGYRINRAGDDAAGLAISEKMRGQIRGLNQASRNAQDGISLIQTAEGALDETHAILQRMRELAVQSSTDTNTDADRTNIQDEIDQLSSEITRISETTEFNTMALLDGSFEGKRFHIGANENQDITFDVNNMSADALGLKSDVMKRESAEIGSGSNIKISVADGKKVEIDFKQTRNASGTADVTDAPVVATRDEATGKITVTFGASGVTLDDLKAELDKLGVNVEVGDAAKGIDLKQLLGETVKAGDFKQAEVRFDGAASGAADIVITNGDIKSINIISGDSNFSGTTVEMKDGKLTVNLGKNAITADELNTLLQDAKITGVTFNTAPKAAEIKDIELKVTKEGEDVVATDVGINVSTQDNASKAITTINTALETVSKERSKLGSIQNRLEHTIKNLDTSAENLQASEARIRDVDMAKEMMEQTKQNILQQASTAMLAQANQAPQNVLQLLR